MKEWPLIKLSDLILSLESGSRPKGGVDKYEAGLPSIGAEHLGTNGDFNFLNIKYIPDNHYRIMKSGIVQQKDVLIVKDGATTGKTSYVGVSFPFKQAAVNEHVFIVRVNEYLAVPSFVFYFLFSDIGRRLIMKDFRGATIGGISRHFVDYIEIPCAPITQQKRIVAKIEELFSRIDAGVAALERVKANLKRFRASVLKDAVEGKLTEEWRKKYPPKEPASKLLERILSERRSKWEKEQLAKYKAKGQKPPSEWRDKYKEPINLDIANLPELPEGWSWASFDQLIERSEYGTSVKCDYSANYAPIIRIPNIVGGYLDLSDMKYSTKPLSFNDEGGLMRGDLLMCRTNGSKNLIGKVALIRHEITPSHGFASYLLRFRFVDSELLPLWVYHYLSSTRGRHFIETHAASSAGQHNISLSLIHTMPLPLPPTNEQRQIINDIEQSESVIPVLLKLLVEGNKRSNNLHQSILKQAFEGKLVPRDPNDEPTSLLLERIQAERKVNKKKKPQPNER